jgi:hypothetical protein
MKRRRIKMSKNTNYSIETVVSFGPEFSDGSEDYPELRGKIDDCFNSFKAFLKVLYGDTIIPKTDHSDEKHPHFHFMVVPKYLENQKNKKGDLNE